MSLEKFLHWTSKANAKGRAGAADALARAYVAEQLHEADINAAEAAMTFLLDDPSPLVRFALAGALAFSPRTPRPIAFALARDRLDSACLILYGSPVFREGDLVDLFAEGCCTRRQAIAMRHDLPPTICGAIAEVGDRSSVMCMLENRNARIGAAAYVRLAQRFGDNREIRTRLLDRSSLPGHIRCDLIDRVSSVLTQSHLLSAIVGKNRISEITGNASLEAAITLAGRVAGDDLEKLVERLRDTGKLTTAFLLHLLCVGNMDFFAASIAKISDRGFARVRSILVDGRKATIQALFRSCGIEADICGVFVEATLLWRKASRTGDMPDALQFTSMLMQGLADWTDSRAVDDILVVVEGHNLEFRRQTAKAYAQSIVNQAA